MFSILAMEIIAKSSTSSGSEVTFTSGKKGCVHMATLVETGYKCKIFQFFLNFFWHLTFTGGYSKPLGYVLYIFQLSIYFQYAI